MTRSKREPSNGNSLLPNPAVAKLHLLAPHALSLNGLGHDEQARSPSFITLNIESSIVEHVQNAKAVGSPKIGRIVGERGSRIIAGCRYIAAEIVLGVRFKEKSCRGSTAELNATRVSYPAGGRGRPRTGQCQTGQDSFRQAHRHSFYDIQSERD